MKKNIAVKVVAFLALFWIIISVVWTWILILLWDNNQAETNLSLEQIQKIIDDEKAKVLTWTTNTWNQNK